MEGRCNVRPGNWVGAGTNEGRRSGGEVRRVEGCDFVGDEARDVGGAIARADVELERVGEQLIPRGLKEV